MTTYFKDQTDDFIQQVALLIQSGKDAQAFEEILALPDMGKLDIIDSLAVRCPQTEDLRSHLAIARTYYLIKNSALVRARARSLVRERACELARELACDLTMTLTQALNSLRGLDLGRGLDLALDLARSLDIALDLARNLVLDSTLVRGLTQALESARNLAMGGDLMRGHSNARKSPFVMSYMRALGEITHIIVLLTSGVFPFPDIIRDAVSLYYQKLADALDEVLFLQQKQTESVLVIVRQIVEKLLEGKLRHITLEGAAGLNSEVNASQIAPYLQAMSDYLQLYAELLDKPFKGLTLIQLEPETPKIELVGLGDFIGVLKDLFQFRGPADDVTAQAMSRQKHQLEHKLAQAAFEQRMARHELENSNREIAIKVQLDDIETHARKIQQDTEAALQDLIRTQKAVNERHERYYMETATHAIETAFFSMAFDVRFAAAMRLAVIYQQIDATGLKARFGFHDSPRPTAAS